MTQRHISRIPITIVLVFLMSVSGFTAVTTDVTSSAGSDQGKYKLVFNPIVGETLTYEISQTVSSGSGWKGKTFKTDSKGIVSRTITDGVPNISSTVSRIFTIISAIQESVASTRPTQGITPTDSNNTDTSSDKDLRVTTPQVYTEATLSAITLDGRAKPLSNPGYGLLPRFGVAVEPANGIMWTRLPERSVSIGDKWNYQLEAPFPMDVTSNLIREESIGQWQCLVIETTAQSTETSVKNTIKETVWLEEQTEMPLQIHMTWSIGDQVNCSISMKMTKRTVMDSPATISFTQQQSLLVSYILREIEAAQNSLYGSPVERIRAARRIASLFVQEYGKDGWGEVMNQFNNTYLQRLESNTASWPASKQPEKTTNNGK